MEEKKCLGEIETSWKKLKKPKGRIAVDSSEREAGTFKTLLSHVKDFGC